jgi:hypothetical protein
LTSTPNAIAERVRKIGGTTLRSIGQIGRLQRFLDNDADYVTPRDMLAELREDNKHLASHMRETHALCDEHGDVASASLLESWIDEPSGGRGPSSRPAAKGSDEDAGVPRAPSPCDRAASGMSPAPTSWSMAA